MKLQPAADLISHLVLDLVLRKSVPQRTFFVGSLNLADSSTISEKHERQTIHSSLTYQQYPTVWLNMCMSALRWPHFCRLAAPRFAVVKGGRGVSCCCRPSCSSIVFFHIQ